MPRDIMDMGTMELYKRMPANGYKDIGYQHGELCSNCGQNEYEDVSGNFAARKKKVRNYERHCPSCHCPPERRRFSSPGRPKTSGNVEATLNRYERVSAGPISSAIKKSQSSPLSQNVCWHDCQTSAHSRCPKRLLQARRQRRNEHDKYLSGAFRVKGDTINTELTNEDAEACSKYTQPAPIKSSLKKHNRCREPEGSPDEQEYSEGESEVSMKCNQYVRQSRKSHVLNLGSRRHYVGGDGEYITETRNGSDIDCRQNERECQEMRKLILRLEDFEKLKRDETSMIDEDDKRIERRKLDIARTMKPKKPSSTFYRATSKASIVKESIDKPAKELVLNGSAHLAKLDLRATKNHILESIDHMLGTMDDAKNDAPPQEQTESETIEKISRELQENGWQLLFNALAIHRDSADSSKRNVRLECLNHIRQQLDKLYALESTLDNCQSRLQSLSGHDAPCNEEHQQSHQPLEQKIADS